MKARGADTIEVQEFWIRGEMGFVDHFWYLPEYDLCYGDKYPMIVEK